MTIKEKQIKGDAFYGYGKVFCSTCPSRFGHVVLGVEGWGDYESPELAPAKIEKLRQIAEGHDKGTGGRHSIIFNIYSK